MIRVYLMIFPMLMMIFKVFCLLQRVKCFRGKYMMTFNGFVHKYGSKNKTAINIKIYEVLKKIRLDSKLGIYLREGDFQQLMV